MYFTTSPSQRLFYFILSFKKKEDFVVVVADCHNMGTFKSCLSEVWTIRPLSNRDKFSVPYLPDVWLVRKYKSRSCPLIFFVTESKVAFLIDNFCFCYSGSVERPIIAYRRTTASKHYYTNLTIILFFLCVFMQKVIGTTDIYNFCA